MRYLSVCSGIEAATVAWHHLGWTPVAFSEIEPFPAAVLAYHYPDVPNYGDMTKHKEWPLEPGSIDLLVGGTPCQSFSVAGLRKGISDPRGGLMLTYLEIARRLRPRWIVWENVPGVLSSGGGRDFGSFLGALVELGYGVAYRVLDAQWVRTQRHPRAVPQRRRRVFVVGCFGDGERAAQVLFERESLQRDSAARRASREGIAADAEAGARTGRWWDGSDCAGTLTKQNAGDNQRMPDKDNFGAVLQPIGFCWQNNDLGLKQDSVIAALRSSAGSSGFHEMNHPVVLARDNAAHAAVAFQACGDRDNPSISVSDTAFCLPANAMSDRGQAVAFDWQSGGDSRGLDPKEPAQLQRCQTPAVAFNGYQRTEQQVSWPIGASDGRKVEVGVRQTMTVRRLTPRECERLQGFPDDWTLIPWRKKPADECPDGPRYKALGNSMAVNCMAWIGERIAAVEARHA